MLASDSKSTSQLNLTLNLRDTQYLVTGRIDPSDVAGLRRRLPRALLRENVIDGESPSPRFVRRSGRYFFLAYVPPNRLLLLDIDRSGEFRLGIRMANDGSDHLDFPRIDLSKPQRFELAYHLIPFLLFGFIGHEIGAAVLTAVFNNLKRPNAFRILNIRFPVLSFSQALKSEAKDIESQIKDKVDAT